MGTHRDVFEQLVKRSLLIKSQIFIQQILYIVIKKEENTSIYKNYFGRIF
ncbi:hypothetical protein M23134_00007 [Microscilla marina ATCC 23134]|uniref:Uncharacterized protein n=1 Tax=Microscilla marina ATCC 23134 TaxID=313606 RepID=A1ZKN8_MICM2|nr:hypothetical protein M23134_00007 [Microscilla marina ATCC 23134]